VGDRFLELSIKFSFYFPNKFFEEKLVFTFFSSFFTLKLDAPIMAKKNFQKCALDVNLVSISASAYSISEKRSNPVTYLQVISLCNEWINYDNVYRAKFSALTAQELCYAYENLDRLV
jgi:hypothetical protein